MRIKTWHEIVKYIEQSYNPNYRFKVEEIHFKEEQGNEEGKDVDFIIEERFETREALIEGIKTIIEHLYKENQAEVMQILNNKILLKDPQEREYQIVIHNLNTKK